MRVVRRVDHMNEEVGLHRLFECGTKSFDQLMREMTNKPDRVGHNRLPKIGQLDLAQRRI